MNTGYTVSRDRAVSLAIAVAIHAAVLIGGTFWVSPVEYGVEAGDGGVEVHLVAALPAPSAGSLAIIAPIESTDKVETEAPGELPPVFEPVAQPVTNAQKETPAASPVEPKPTQAPVANSTLFMGDGSSFIPGKDATTFHSSGGAKTSAAPSYFRNPAPAYPALARENGYEGTVLLHAEVLASGRCGQLSIIESSGYDVLDQAALQAISHWRFKPAKRAGAAVTSWVEIPVRFDLLESEESG